MVRHGDLYSSFRVAACSDESCNSAVVFWTHYSTAIKGKESEAESPADNIPEVWDSYVDGIWHRSRWQQFTLPHATWDLGQGEMPRDP